MDELTKTLKGHLDMISEKQRMLRLIPKLQKRIEDQIDLLQKEALIMDQEIKSGKNLS